MSNELFTSDPTRRQPCYPVPRSVRPTWRLARFRELYEQKRLPVTTDTESDLSRQYTHLPRGAFTPFESPYPSDSDSPDDSF